MILTSKRMDKKEKSNVTCLEEQKEWSICAGLVDTLATSAELKQTQPCYHVNHTLGNEQGLVPSPCCSGLGNGQSRGHLEYSRYKTRLGSGAASATYLHISRGFVWEKAI